MNSLGQMLTPSPRFLRDDVRKLEQDHYQTAIAEYSSNIWQDGVKLVAQFGSVGTPGASDIDLLVITEKNKYPYIKQESESIIRDIDHGRYLFWHPPAIIPEEAIKPASILHTLDNIRPIMGDKSILERTVSPPESLSMIQTAVWNSFVWRSVLSCSYGFQNLRNVLLIISNISQSIQAIGELVESNYAKQISEWAKNDARKHILELPSEERAEITVDILRILLNVWTHMESEFQTYWERQFGLPHQGPSQIVINPPFTGAYITLDHSRMISTIKYPQLLIDRLLSGVHTRKFTLPVFYSHILNGVASLFGYDRSPSCCTNERLETSLESYRSSILKIQSIDKDFSGTASMFNDVFVVPFGLSRKTGRFGREMIYGTLDHT